MFGSHVGRGALVILAFAACRGEPQAPERAPDEQPAWSAIDEPGLAAIAATRGFELGTPVPLAITPDGSVLFRRSKPRDPSAELLQLDPTGKVTTLATPAALLAGAAPADPASAAEGITAIDVSDDGSRVLIPLAGRLFVVERATGASRELAIGDGRSPQLSPDGKRVAYVQGGDLWVLAIGDAKPTRLTQHPADREYATPEPGAEHFGRTRGYWWSPDSQSIAFQRTDASAVEPLYTTDARHPERAPVSIKRTRPGKPLPTVDLGVVSIQGGAPRWVTWEQPRYPYLAQVTWPAGGPLSLVVVGREQTQLAALAVEPATGKTRPLLVDKDPAWVNVAPTALTWLEDGGFLWMTESHGAWSLDQHAADGAAVRTLLTPDFGVRRVLGLSPGGKDVLVEAANDPRERAVWRVPLAGGAPVELTKDGGVHHAIAGHGVIAMRSLLRAGGRASTVVRADGTRVELPSVAEQPPALPTTRLQKVGIQDHAQFAAITRPRSFDPKLTYPVLLLIGDRLDGNIVLDALGSYVMDQWYADAGFVVVRTDGRGTPHQDRDLQRAIAGDVLTLPMSDQLGTLRKLQRKGFPELDLGRVGAIGAGYGGYLAAVGAMIHPDQFAAAVAISPITDWELIDAAYSERFLKTPSTNAEGYRRANAASYAEQLERPLLILHDPADRRVPFTHSLALLEALSAAGKHVQLATVPSGAEPKLEIARAQLALEFLRARIGPPVRAAAKPEPSKADDKDDDAKTSGGTPPAGDAKRN